MLLLVGENFAQLGLPQICRAGNECIEEVPARRERPRLDAERAERHPWHGDTSDPSWHSAPSACGGAAAPGSSVWDVPTQKCPRFYEVTFMWEPLGEREGAEDTGAAGSQGPPDPGCA